MALRLWVQLTNVAQDAWLERLVALPLLLKGRAHAKGDVGVLAKLPETLGA